MWNLLVVARVTFLDKDAHLIIRCNQEVVSCYLHIHITKVWRTAQAQTYAQKTQFYVLCTKHHLDTFTSTRIRTVYPEKKLGVEPLTGIDICNTYLSNTSSAYEPFQNVKYIPDKKTGVAYCLLSNVRSSIRIWYRSSIVKRRNDHALIDVAYIYTSIVESCNPVAFPRL